MADAIWNLALGYPVGIIGVIGLALILAAWVPQTLATIKSKKASMRQEFIMLYLLGSLLLTAHSILLGDAVFLVLNGVAAFVAAVNLYYSLSFKQ